MPRNIPTLQPVDDSSTQSPDDKFPEAGITSLAPTAAGGLDGGSDRPEAGSVIHPTTMPGESATRSPDAGHLDTAPTFGDSPTSRPRDIFDFESGACRTVNGTFGSTSSRNGVQVFFIYEIERVPSLRIAELRETVLPLLQRSFVHFALPFVFPRICSVRDSRSRPSSRHTPHDRNRRQLAVIGISIQPPDTIIENAICSELFDPSHQCAVVQGALTLYHDGAHSVMEELILSDSIRAGMNADAFLAVHPEIVRVSFVGAGIASGHDIVTPPSNGNTTSNGTDITNGGNGSNNISNGNDPTANGNGTATNGNGQPNDRNGPDRTTTFPTDDDDGVDRLRAGLLSAAAVALIVGIFLISRANRPGASSRADFADTDDDDRYLPVNVNSGYESRII